MKKTRQVNIRITEQDYKLLSLKAAEAKMSLSKYIRVSAIFGAKAQSELEDMRMQRNYYKNMALCRTRWLEGEE